MADLGQINAEIALIEELAAYRDMLRLAEAGGPSEMRLSVDELRRIVSDLEAKAASFPREQTHT